MAAAFTPASIFALAQPASAAPTPTNVGNTGTGTLPYTDTGMVAAPGGFLYQHSTAAGRSPVWTGFIPGPSSAAVPLTGLPGTDYPAGVQQRLAVVTDLRGDVAWENLGGTGAGSGPIIPASASSSWTAHPGFDLSAAPGGWVTVGDTVTTPPAPSTTHLLQVLTSGTVTDIGALPAAGSYSVVGGPSGAIYQYSTYNPATNTNTSSAWIYVPYASPNTPVPLAADTSADNCTAVFASDAICLQSTSTGGQIPFLVPLNGSADSSVTPPSGSFFATGTSTEAAWVNSDRSVSYEPWGGTTSTTVSSGAGIPAADLVSDGTNLFISGGSGSSAGIGELGPPSTTVATLVTESDGPVEAGGVALTPGRVAWNDDATPTATLASGAGPLWDRTLTSSGALPTGSSPNLIVTDASDYSLSSPSNLSISGRRTLYVNAAKNITLRDPAASTPNSTVGSVGGHPPTVSGSRVLWYDSTAAKWKLRDLNTGTDADLSGIIGKSDLATLWGNYIAYEKASDASVWRWDVSTNAQVQVLASPETTTKTCYPAFGPYVAGDYVAWSLDCYDSNPSNPPFGLVSGYENVTAGSAAVDLSTSGYVVALSGSYVATAMGFPSPQQSLPITVTQLGTSTATSPGSASGPVALDGSIAAWIDGSGNVVDFGLPHVAEVPRYLGNGVDPSGLTLPGGTWNGEWDTSGALTSCNVTITQGSTTVATVPCDTTDMALGEAVVSWDGTNGTSPVADGNYTWTLNASGADGTLAGPDGKSLTLSGPIAVTPPLPQPPTAVTATAGVDSATLSWTPPASGPLPNSYVVSSNPATSDVSAPGTSATVTGLTPGVSYTFTVEAVDASGNSAPSAPSNAVVPTSVAPQNTKSTTGSDPTATTSTTSSSGTVTVTASATGTGTVTVSTYPSDPVGGFQIAGTYFDVSITSDSSFTSLTINVCGLPSKSQLSWWNPAAQAFQVIATADSTGCVNFTITPSTSPSLSDLDGTVFVVGLPSQGYTMVASDGGVFPIGGAPFFGSMGNKALNAPIVGMAMTPDGGGYWLVGADGGVFNFGDATYYGSKGGQHLNAPIVGIASSPTGNGYWLVGGDGGVFNFGDAGYYGSTGNRVLNKPIVGMATDATTGGYWLVASDGGIFNFNAPYEGSTGNRVLNKPVVGMAVDATTGGYWLVASDGGIFNFNAPYLGSTGNRVLNQPVVGMGADPNSGGYWLFASDGGVFNFGGSTLYGSLAGRHLNKPVVGGVAG